MLISFASRTISRAIPLLPPDGRGDRLIRGLRNHLFLCWVRPPVLVLLRPILNRYSFSITQAGHLANRLADRHFIRTISPFGVLGRKSR
jgi:hypothetical protein